MRLIERLPLIDSDESPWLTLVDTQPTIIGTEPKLIGAGSH